MIKIRPLYCPNLLLLDSAKELIFPLEEAKSIIEKLSKGNDLIVVYINHEIEELNESQIVVRSFNHAIYKAKGNNENSLFSQLLNAGAKHVYYIKTDISHYRNGFVHFYDILGSDYPIVCISNLLANQLQCAGIVIPDGTSENDKIELSGTILPSVDLFTSKELLCQKAEYINKQLKIVGVT